MIFPSEELLSKLCYNWISAGKVTCVWQQSGGKEHPGDFKIVGPLPARDKTKPTDYRCFIATHLQDGCLYFNRQTHLNSAISINTLCNALKCTLCSKEEVLVVIMFYNHYRTKTTLIS